MKKYILIVALFFFITFGLTAQAWTKVFSGDYYDAYSVYFTNVNTGYLATNNGTIFKTTNAGISWNSILVGTTTIFRAIRFTNSNTGYVCGSNGRILKTIDAGSTWIALNSGTQSGLNSIYFTDDNTGFVAGNGGVILKTTNAGGSWTILPSGTTQPLNSLFFTDSNTGYVVGEGGTILKTVNAGINWISTNSGTLEKLTSICFTSSNIGYIVGKRVMLKTLDSGSKWSLTSNTYALSSICFTNANTGYVAGKNITGQSLGCIGKTTDAGLTWTYKQTSWTSAEVQFIFFVDQNNGYVSNSQNTLTKTTNAGIDWSDDSFGNPETLTSVFFTDDNTGYTLSNATYITTGNPCLIKKTIDGGKNWNIIHRTSGYYLNKVLFTNPNTGYAVGSNNICKTIDAGATWTTTTINTGNITSIYFTDAKTGYITASSYGAIYKTIDGGDSWSILVSGVYERFFFSIFFVDDKTGFAVGSNGKNGIIYKTSDGGKSWTEETYLTTNAFRSIYFTSAKIGLCVGQGVIYRSTDLGKTWSQVYSGSDFFSSVYFADDNIGFVGGSVGNDHKILQSKDAGKTWTTSISGFNRTIYGFNFPRVYTGYAVGDANTVMKYDTCNSFTADLSQTNVKCYEINNGSASVTVKGGIPPFTYLWSNGQTTPTISGLSPGLYSVTVKMKGQECPITKSVTITGPSAPLSADFAIKPNTICSGICDGTLTINATGGTLPYTYKWDVNANNQTTKTITGLCSGKYSVVVTDANGCSISKEVVLTSTSNYNSQVYLTNIAAVDQVNVSPAFTSYYAYNLPSTITPNPTNLRNFVDPGKKVRFKVECQNYKSNGQSIVSGICKVRSNSQYVTVTDSTSALNNIGWNQKAWSADEFEIYIASDTPRGTVAYIDFIVLENGINYPTTCIPIPISPLVYSPTTPSTIDDDNNPDSKGNNNDICEPNETIEFYPWLDNISTLNAEYVRGRFENLDDRSYVNIWNNASGVGTTVYDATWWNYAFAIPQKITAGKTNATPEFDFVFDYKNVNTSIPFNLYLVMAGGFKLFSGNALSLVQWSLPYTFNNAGATSINSVFESNNGLNVYPNPSSDFIIVDLHDSDQSVIFELFDLQGRKLISKVIGNNGKVSLDGLIGGMYLYQLNLNGKIKSGKLVKK